MGVRLLAGAALAAQVASLLLAAPAAATEASAASGPVRKVVQLLQDLSAKLEED